MFLINHSVSISFLLNALSVAAAAAADCNLVVLHPIGNHETGVRVRAVCGIRRREGLVNKIQKLCLEVEAEWTAIQDNARSRNLAGPCW